MRDAALERMAAGDIRDAAEKAWCATVRATEALLLVRTGQEPGTSTMAGRRLRTLSMDDQSLRELRRSYLERQSVLHGECFYHGYYDLGRWRLGPRDLGLRPGHRSVWPTADPAPLMVSLSNHPARATPRPI